MVLLALRATPESVDRMEGIAWWLLGICVIVGIAYSGLRFGLYHTKLNANGTRRNIILGGLWLSSTYCQSFHEKNKVT